MDIELPHFQLPFRFVGNGAVNEDGKKILSAAVHEQDSVDEIATCVEIILRCPLGFRDELLEFGAPGDVVFAQTPLDLSAAKSAVASWEPRANADYEESGSAFDEGIRNIGVMINPERE